MIYTKNILTLTLLCACACTILACNSNKTCDHDFIYHQAVLNEETNGTEAYYSCSKCALLFDENKETIETIPVAAPTRKILIPSKKNGKKYSFIDSLVQGYLNCKTPEEVATYLYNNKDKHNSEALSSVGVSWKNNGSSGVYTYEFASDNEFKNIIYSGNTTSTSCKFENVLPGTYYWRVKDKNHPENTSVTDTFSFSGIRALETKGVANFRDIGGWPTYTGDQVKYGLLYRCALPSDTDLTLFTNLGIKTQLDLRQLKDTEGCSGVGGQVNYFAPCEVNSYWPQYSYIFGTEYPQYATQTVNYMKNVFDVLSNSDSYPLAFHCKHGADRTGTLAFIINGLCGVSYEDLTKDFELTSFFTSSRWRSEIIPDDNGYKFDLKQGPISYDTTMGTVYWEPLYTTMMELYGGEGVTLQQAIYKYLTTEIGISKKQIQDTLSNILLGEAYKSLFND